MGMRLFPACNHVPFFNILPPPPSEKHSYPTDIACRCNARVRENVIFLLSGEMAELQCVPLEELMAEIQERGIVLDSGQPLEEIRSPSKKKQKKEVAPSSGTWQILQDKSLVPSFDNFTLQCYTRQTPLPADLTQLETQAVMFQLIQIMVDRGVQDTEEFSMLVFGNIIACVTNAFYAYKKNDHRIKFKVLPAVYVDPFDKRKNRFCDYTIMKVINTKTYIVAEF